ncbi:hypothetical protein PR003_g28772 [Phytophthora rubi]|uniref:Uncharacterized protein n=1 Tax=Phytophthora rubi TaxID=129364 RepID=A0A6A3HI40_9STRA|nr:hypothetical protein PR002_g27861 [Phytophthora rubi]KAE8968394.1 hypothetical protein PR001_g27804 [Phytophthora rubi]KAE9277510.1 hypothetical protein PR003_g28772 [Phytophthora rubi]
MYFTIAGVMVVNLFFYLVVMHKMQFGMIPRLEKKSAEEDEKDAPVYKLSADPRSVN